MGMLAELKVRARALKAETQALLLAVADPRTPWYARALALAVIGYLASPIDLIPDFIPILGYLDDLILVPLGIKLVLKLIPLEVMAESRARVAEQQEKSPNWVAGVVIICIWLALFTLLSSWLWRIFHK